MYNGPLQSFGNIKILKSTDELLLKQNSIILIYLPTLGGKRLFFTFLFLLHVKVSRCQVVT